MDPIKEAFRKVKEDLLFLQDQIEELKLALKTQQTLDTNRQTDKQITTTHNLNELPQQAPEAQKSPISSISIGNEGVPTDKQTNRQTDRHMKMDKIEHISNTLDSLDTLKKDLRRQFKQLTNQEMLIFSTLYQLDSQQQQVSYKDIAKKLSLSESSIRDYINKITKKGIPILKTKQNNKRIILNIPEELKKLASLHTILALREL